MHFNNLKCSVQYILLEGVFSVLRKAVCVTGSRKIALAMQGHGRTDLHGLLLKKQYPVHGIPHRPAPRLFAILRQHGLHFPLRIGLAGDHSARIRPGSIPGSTPVRVYGQDLQNAFCKSLFGCSINAYFWVPLKPEKASSPMPGLEADPLGDIT